MAMSSCRRSSAATISASAAPDAGFKTCCMPGGRFDGSDRDDYFQGVSRGGVPFSPCGRRWRRAAPTDEGSRDAGRLPNATLTIQRSATPHPALRATFSRRGRRGARRRAALSPSWSGLSRPSTSCDATGRPARETPLARSLPCEDVDGRHRGDHDGRGKLIPAPFNLPYPPLAHHPYGAAVRRYARGWVRVGACGRGLRPAPGRLREPTWGHYDPCARSSLEGRPGDTIPFDPPMRQPEEGNWRKRTAEEDAGPTAEARPGALKSPKAERHGACGQWLNLSARILAQRMRTIQTRLAALRQPRSLDAPAGWLRAGRLMRHSRALTRESQDKKAPTKPLPA
jgi:hypothetical protein